MLGQWRSARRILGAHSRRLSSSLNLSHFNSEGINLNSECALKLEEIEDLLRRLDQGAKATEESYAVLLKHCGNLKLPSHGKRVHQSLEKNGGVRGRYLRNMIMEMYGKCGSPEDAEVVFRSIINPNVFSYTMLMLAYGQNDLEKEAWDIFKLMDLDGVFPTEVAYMNALAICSRLGNLRDGKVLHWCVMGTELENSVILQTALCSMYTGCSRLDLARQVFDGMAEKSVVTWNAMISAYAHNGLGKEAMRLFWRMEQDGWKPDSVTFLVLVEVSEVLGDLKQVDRIQKRVYETGLTSKKSLQTAILTFYGKHGNIQGARNLFEAMESRNVISWNAMIGLYAQHGFARESVELYKRMKVDKTVKADEVTFVNVLNGCASLGELEVGKKVHKDIVSCGLEKHVMVLNALLNMYGRCGSLQCSREVFDVMPRIGSSWTVMMTQYAEHGQGFVAVDLFRDMLIEGCEIDNITLVIILSVCSHLGLLAEGRDLFLSLHQDYGICYTSEHYGCIVDLLARAGMLELAEEFLELVPSRECPVSWTALLNSCRMHGDVERGTRAAARMIEIDPDDSGTYSMLEQLYSKAGRWDDLVQLQKLMESRGIALKAVSVEEGLFG